MRILVINLKCRIFVVGSRYKCSPIGLLRNFSYFKATKTDKQGQADTVYLYHNATVQSSFDDKVFTTPDIVVSKN
jgi:hypothetical protein